MFVNTELFTLSYGSLVRSIVKETNNIEDANSKLAKIGTNIGNRITDDFVVNYEKTRFKNLREACDSLVEYFLKHYFGINSSITESSENRCVIRFGDNAISRYVKIPAEYDGLVYLQPILSSIKTTLSLLHFNVEVNMIHDMLRSSDYNEIEIKLIEILYDSLPPGEYI